MNINRLISTARERIVICDGAVGTELHGEPETTDYVDRLNISNPDKIANIHKAYIRAGADIITTNTLNSNAVQMREIGSVESLNTKGVELARTAVRTASEYDGLGMIGGVVGPTTIQIDDITSKNYERLVQVYRDQIRMIHTTGVDLMLVETMIDIGNITAALKAYESVLRETNSNIPLWLSIAPIIEGNRFAAGERVIDYLDSLNQSGLLILGLNCTDNFVAAYEILAELKKRTDVMTAFYPNAGISTDYGEYPLDIEAWVSKFEPLFEERLINIAGGCCGTNPDYIKALYRMAAEYEPRQFDSI